MHRAALLTGILFALSACASRPPAPAPAAHEELRQFNIASEDAPRALNEYAVQSNTQVLFDFRALQNRQTNGVDGMYTPSAALQQMLKGNHLVADNVNDHTVAIVPR